MALTNINFMMKLVKSYLSGKIDRTSFELDFDWEFDVRYEKMYREDADIAEYFYDCIVKVAFAKGRNLSDEKFLGLLEDEYDRVKDLIDNGVW